MADMLALLPKISSSSLARTTLSMHFLPLPDGDDETDSHLLESKEIVTETLVVVEEGLQQLAVTTLDEPRVFYDVHELKAPLQLSKPLGPGKPVEQFMWVSC
jgi:hypothetical protein